jgi:predicted hydrolase (HD superfamily)
MNREQALELIREHVKNENIVKHMMALEVLMGGVYDELQRRGNNDLGGTKEEWMTAGLMHDGDYCEGVPPEKQGIQITDWAREKGYEIPGNVAYTMAAHNWSNTKVEPKSLMDWTIFCGDSLTGLITACALVRPDRKLSSVNLESVMKKFLQKSFAAGTRREDIAKCEEKIGINLSDFISISLASMQAVHEDLGL